MSRKQTRVTVHDADGESLANQPFIDKTKTPSATEQASLDLSEHGRISIETVSHEESLTMDKENVEDIAPKQRLCVEDFVASYDDGRIDLAYPEHLEFKSSSECYPRSYYTLSGKERLLLLFAENFRRQFNSSYPNRRPLLLATKNECNVQKLVCTTIRPTAFLFPSLISSLEGCAEFVADFIEYQPLENPGALPPFLVSPTTLLRRRCGNSFEMATLLCSMLIGAGFPALVVSGSAKRDTVNNDQRNVKYSLPDDQECSKDQDEKSEILKMKGSDKYKLKSKPDLVSHLTDQLEQMRLEKENQEKFLREEAERVQRENLEDEASFNDPYRLSHSWVVVIHNAPWSCKPRSKIINEDGDKVDAPPSATFIEPSTGFQHDPSSKAYIHIESIWNHLNYYVNLQTCRIRDMQWDLRDSSHWEHLLAGEPPEMRVKEQCSDENITNESGELSVEKHLDMGRSWVEKLNISDKDFDERYPNLHKAVYYHRVLHERFSNYIQPDGKMMQVTLFSDDNYEVPEIRWDWYENRDDLLTNIKFVFSTGQTEESFQKGRPDSLKHFIHNSDDKQPKILHFYSSPRLDSMRLCEVHNNKIMLHFEKSPGACFYKEFITKYDMTKLLEITEKFQRDTVKPANEDISIRSFLLSKNKILLKFHYVCGALTAAITEFIKPPKPDYGQEIIFDPSLTKGYKFGESNPDPTELELYLLLLDQLRAEESAKKSFDRTIDELNNIFDRRKREIKHTNLKFRAFDPLRNETARKLRLERDELEKQIKKDRRVNLPDFLAPYLVPYDGRTLNPKESLTAYNSCLNDLKTRFVSLLNELQRRYEDLTAEAQSLKKFLGKFHNKFDDFDYERLLQESKDLELNKRMVQKRLTITHEEAQKKYDLVKQSLLKDKRLQLKSISVVGK
ncbi:coiled-coil domain-containing protein lobo [Episyrphus balteatus]|uniref:coiled-coil domain-containing protein lobo n=1 Tax=Episyrphus balteatus TaxID=286459 RepID=UPI00248588BB|nr:coiled-coil domain-containing protein lobo [Episyrphus balteatus]